MMRASEPRLRPLSADEWDEDVRQMLGGTTGVGDGRVLNIFATLAHHPKLVKRWTVFGNHVLFKSTLPERERELVILRVAWRAQAEYEWGQHVVIARRCGVTDEEIEWVKLGPEAIGWSPFDATLLRAVDELRDDSVISDATWKALGERYDDKQCLDLIFTVGQYTLVAMALNSLGVELDDGVPGFDG
jgi:4-carboxymuconolactone decarboxylase